jgi:very-short-patch-repair endonuclease
VTRTQLLAAGLSSATIGRWAARGRLLRVHTGVYAVGHRRGEAVARAAAALLACGDRAALFNETAAALWGFRLRWQLIPEVCGPDRRRRPGIRHHETRTLSRRDIRRHRGLRVTSPARTLDDIKDRLTPAQFTRAVNDARLSGVLNGADLERFAAPGQGPTRSRFEDEVAAVLHARGFPQPQVNASVLGFEVDFLFPDYMVIVELDGWTYHSYQPTWERDRTRDTLTAAAGFVTIRISWLRWQDDREGVLSDLAAVLARRLAASATGHPHPGGHNQGRRASYGLLPWF